MNVYKKYCPNVFVAECDEKHEKDEVIDVETKYGKINKCLVWNLIKQGENGKFYYSITRADGFNSQERAKRHAEKYQEWAKSASKKSDQYYKASNKDREFLSMAEPIKVGHHSEAGHRKMIDDAWKNMGKSVEQDKKAKAHLYKADYYNKLAEKIDLSMPESIEYFAHKVELAKAEHTGLKNGTIPKEHAYSLTYAKKNLNEAEKKYKIALLLWGAK